MNTTTQADSKKVGFKGKIDRFFKISERGSTIGRELLGGLIIFLAMIYILPVNADILGNGANMGFAAVFVATAIATGVTTILMGLIANYPIGLSAGMGLNALMAYTVCGSLGFTWQEALFSVFVSGTIFFILSISSIRQMIIRSIPDVLKNAVGVGIGFFIAFIGLKNSGIVIGNESTLVGLGDFTQPIVIITVISIFMAKYAAKSHYLATC